MEHIMAHPWMSQGSSLPFGPAPFPNRITPDEIRDEIVEHMVNRLKVRELYMAKTDLMSLGMYTQFYLIICRYDPQ